MGNGCIRIFLGAYINQTNAQNHNCRELAKHLDKSKFIVSTLAINHGDLGIFSEEGVKVFNCYYPVKISGLIGYMWGIINSDVVYLPRADFLGWQIFLLKLFKRKSFKTIENIIDEVALKSALSVPHKKLRHIRDYYNYCNRNYPITTYLGAYNKQHYQVDFDLPVLPVPTDTSFFSKYYRVRKQLKKVVFIGNDFYRKDLTEFIDLANTFKGLEFCVIGRGEIGPYKQQCLYKNVTFFGSLNHLEIVDVLKDVDLHFLASKSEGFGKTTIECASMGIPTIIYGHYGAEEWVKEGEGIVVQNEDEVRATIDSLCTNPEKLMGLSKQCIQLSGRFASEEVVKLYEQVIEDINSE